jgi:hypothetical protein
MATLYLNLTIGSPKASGQFYVSQTRGTAVAGDVTVVVNTTQANGKAMTGSALRSALGAAVDHFKSGSGEFPNT